MDTLLQSPWVAWFLIGFLIVEGVILLAIWRRSQRGLPPLQTISFLGAGLGFAVALLSVLSQWPGFVLAAALLFAFALHVLDIYLRWQR